MIFPIFRNLQRSMARGAVGTTVSVSRLDYIISRGKNKMLSVCNNSSRLRQKPVIAVSGQEQFLHHKDDNDNDEESDSHDDDASSTPIVLPHGHNESHKGKSIQLNNPATWPINSNEARQARDEFVRDGFRRLYARAQVPHGRNNDREEDHHDSMDQGGVVAAAVRELGWNFGRRMESVQDEGDRDDWSSVMEHEWMYLAQ